MEKIDTQPLDSPLLVRVFGEEPFVRVSATFESTLGLTARDLERRPLLDWIHPEDRDALAGLIEAKEGSLEARHAARNRGWLPFSWSVRELDQGYALLGRAAGSGDAPLDRAIRPVSGGPSTIAKTLEQMAQIVEAQNPGFLCSILLVDSESQTVTVGAGPSLPKEYNDAVEGLHIGPTVGSCGTAAYWKVPVIVNDIDTDPLWKDLRDAAKIAGVSACWSMPVTSANGEVLGAMALYSRAPQAPTAEQLRSLDIAAQMVGLAIERDNLEMQLRQAAKMEALGVLAGGIAHDFNNLMAVVASNSQLALDLVGKGSQTGAYLSDVLSAAEAASKLCNEMLTYAGKGVAATRSIECNTFVQDLGELLRVALSRKATLAYELSASRLHVIADETQLRQVLMNLITNASEALQDRPGKIVVKTSLARIARHDPKLLRPDGWLEPGEYVCIQVSDTGVGMNKITQARVFDPFYSTKETGRGLGLAAAQGIIMNHGGAITLESAEGKGTTFSLVLPKPATKAVAAPNTASELPIAAGANVLLVDDHPLARRALANLLEAEGHSVICGNDGQEALDIFRESGDSIDCVVLDYSMPKLNGIEVVGEIRKSSVDIPIILCSGYAEADVRKWSDGADINFSVQKNQPNVLLKTVSQALAR